MNKVDHGGPAFPIPLNKGDSYVAHAICDGMTLRDYFAALAMQGKLASGRVNVDLASGRYSDSVAEGCYALADAMIKARNGGK